MRKTFVSLSRESEKQVIIEDLHRMSIFECPRGRDLKELDYHTLRSLLVMEQAVRA